MATHFTSNAGAGSRLFIAALAGLAGLAAAPLHAEGPPHYFAFGAIYGEPDNGRDVDYSTGFHAAYAARLDARRWWELRVFSNILDTGGQTAIDYYQTGAGLDLLQPLGSESSGHAYVLAGVGLVANDVKPDSDDGSSYYVNAGVGWRLKTWESWGVRPRAEFRYIYDSFTTGQTDAVLGITLEIPPRSQRVVEEIIQVEKVVEVPVEVERVVEREMECQAPAAPAG